MCGLGNVLWSFVVMASSGRSWPVLVRGKGVFAVVDGGGDDGDEGGRDQAKQTCEEIKAKLHRKVRKKVERKEGDYQKFLQDGGHDFFLGFWSFENS